MPQDQDRPPPKVINPLRWSAVAFLWPRRYIDVDAVVDINLEAFSDRYSWRQDAWNGLRDIAKPVSETVADERGDCEDYALVAASCLLRRGADDVHIAACFKRVWGVPVPRHVVAIGGDAVYSSGIIHEMSLEEYLGQSDYWFALRRSV